ncbi:NADH-quinone oxidoreductase subunit C [Streptomyces brevispora]|uniref:NADH-quinone oxidoreductase subunit C n=1 Tax=Streptomyces brevispora TaxID=887462 RepID=A0ABZ1G3W1_9ACTN|nr:NADH-quinone oxidoreductase subunit C [Streptomyces brevispora]WSC13925.1 NADH-quinone oxidoreductase subunit C [Streptomyces brevispora]
MTAAERYDRLPDAVTEIFGEDATAEQAYDLLTVDVPPASWIAALETARDGLGCTYFDWLSAVDEPGTGFRVSAHLAALPDRSGPGPAVRRLLVRTTVPHEAAVLPTAIDVYAGAAWHERETHEMFGIAFDGHPHLVPLLLPEGFEGHPLRKDFVLAARVAKAWPGAKEPGESEHGGPKRRTMLPPGVPDPNEWGPLKGQLPPAPTRPTRTARPAGDRPARRTRSASDGSASQQPAAASPTAVDPAAVPTVVDPTVVDPAAGGDSAVADKATGGKTTEDKATGNPAAGGGAPAGSAPTADAPWHNARPAFDDSPGPDAETSGTGASTSRPPRRPRSGGPEAEPPVREEAGRGEAQRNGTPTATPPTPAPPTEPLTEPPAGHSSDAADTSEAPEPPAGHSSDAADTSEAPEPPNTPDTPDTPPNTPAGGDTE